MTEPGRQDDSLAVVALDDDYSFGVLSSTLHRQWFDERCSRLKADPGTPPRRCSTPSHGRPTPHRTRWRASLVLASEILDLRESYLNRGLTLGQQYDTLRTDGQSQLQDLHDDLADTVHELYGFSTEDDTLAQVLALNLSIADGPGHARGPGGADLHGHTDRPSG